MIYVSYELNSLEHNQDFNVHNYSGSTVTRRRYLFSGDEGICKVIPNPLSMFLPTKIYFKNKTRLFI